MPQNSFYFWNKRNDSEMMGISQPQNALFCKICWPFLRFDHTGLSRLSGQLHEEIPVYMVDSSAMPKISFYGGAGTVTGSKYLLEHQGKRVLVDCGLFQGLKELRERNWQAPPFDPAAIDAVVITHAHIDHTGYLPKLVQLGFRGDIVTSKATADLMKILLPDSARLQEEEADYRNRHQLTSHTPALPLYTEDDARAALSRL